MRSASKRVRYQILERDEFACRYCGANGPGTFLEVDHVVPHSRGGSNDTWNLTAACQPCNAGKTDRMPTDEIIRAVYEADVAFVYDHGPYWPCRDCGKPVNMSDSMEWAAEYDWIDCSTCNSIKCDAFDAGRGIVRTKVAGA